MLLIEFVVKQQQRPGSGIQQRLRVGQLQLR
jgi:hypothetical protein